MKLEDAQTRIDDTLARMAELYLHDVFDEWILLSLEPGAAGVLAYNGPREAEYEKTFLKDIRPLKADLGSGQYGVGDFAFSDQGEGELHDAFIVAGKNLYLICNNTRRAMPEITADKLWLKAQKPFVELSETFRTDPVERD